LAAVLDGFLCGGWRGKEVGLVSLLDGSDLDAFPLLGAGVNFASSTAALSCFAISWVLAAVFSVLSMRHVGWATRWDITRLGAAREILPRLNMIPGI
jgi:hypothetical protein